MPDKVLEKVAANGLISRRHLLRLGVSSTGLALSGAALGADSEISFQIPTWSRQPGPGASAYGARSTYAENLERLAGQPNPTYPGGGASRSPLQQLQGTITPNSLHFERHHAGIPNIDPSQHNLVINGLVRQPLVFRYEDLLKYQIDRKSVV